METRFIYASVQRQKLSTVDLTKRIINFCHYPALLMDSHNSFDSKIVDIADDPQKYLQNIL
jgi:hypothetical protein